VHFKDWNICLNEITNVENSNGNENHSEEWNMLQCQQMKNIQYNLC
jgi:hypothetical protein